MRVKVKSMGNELVTNRRDIQHGRCEISLSVTEAQQRMFRLAKRDHNLTLNVLHAETKIPESTLRGWIDGTSMMPIDGLVRLAGVIPNELLGLIFDPVGKTICDAGDDATDNGTDEAVIAALELALTWAKARSQESPGGPAIVHCERPDLNQARERAADKLRSVA